MNQKLRELTEQSELHVTLLFNKDRLEKFAKLIIKECGRIADESVEIGIPSYDIERHFGIE